MSRISRDFRGPIPIRPLLNILFAYPSRSSEFDQNYVSLRSNTSIKPVRESAVSGRDDRGHHPVPTRNIGLQERRHIAVLVQKISIGKRDPVLGGRKIDMRINPESRNAPMVTPIRLPVKTLVGIEPQRRRKHMRAVLLHGRRRLIIWSLALHKQPCTPRRKSRWSRRYPVSSPVSVFAGLPAAS